MYLKNYFALYKHTLYWLISKLLIINNHLLPTSVLLNIGTGNKQYTNDGLIHTATVVCV